MIMLWNIVLSEGFIARFSQIYTALNVELALNAVSLRLEISLVTSAPTLTLTFILVVCP